MGPNDAMRISRAGLRVTMDAENCSLIAFKPTPSDPWTIGFGHTGSDVHEGMTCTIEQAMDWLLDDMSSAEKTVKSAVVIPLTQEEYDALCDFVYNVGAGHFLGSTLRALLNAGNVQGAADEFMKWDMAGGHVLQGLINRRSAEMAEFLLGANFSVQVPQNAA
jgi:lysozyme